MTEKKDVPELEEVHLEKMQLEETRRSLLKNYHSNIQTHAGYLIALIVGALAVFSRLDIFFGNGEFVVHAGWIFLFLVGVMIITGTWTILRIIYWTSYVNYCILFTKKQVLEYFNKKNRKHQAYMTNEKGFPPSTAVIQWSIDQIHDEARLPTDKQIAMITTSRGFKWFGLFIVVVFTYLILIGFALRL
jgi:hypothetical protein